MMLPFGNTQVELHGGGVIWFPEYKLLCASDIHFEKGSFFRRFGTLLPPYDTRTTLARLAEVMEYFKPEIFLSLGDSFHDVHALERMDAQDSALLDRLIASVREWVWVEGNHDPVIAENLGGARHEVFTIGDITFRHEADPVSTEWEISGHYHPKARISTRGLGMRLPCFVAAHKKLLMPAFGSYTGGLDVTNPAISKLFPLTDRDLYLLQGGRVIKWCER